MVAVSKAVKPRGILDTCSHPLHSWIIIDQESHDPPLGFSRGGVLEVSRGRTKINHDHDITETSDEFFLFARATEWLTIPFPVKTIRW